jgi:hypothetical protein
LSKDSITFAEFVQLGVIVLDVLTGKGPVGKEISDSRSQARGR